MNSSLFNMFNSPLDATPTEALALALKKGKPIENSTLYAMACQLIYRSWAESIGEDKVPYAIYLYNAEFDQACVTRVAKRHIQKIADLKLEGTPGWDITKRVDIASAIKQVIYVGKLDQDGVEHTDEVVGLKRFKQEWLGE